MRAATHAWTLAILCLMGPSALSTGQTHSFARVVDLGHPLSETDPTWTGQRVFTHTPTGKPGTGDFFGGKFSSDEHFGTHLDAPAHLGGEWTVERIPVERLVRPGLCLNVEAQVRGADDYQVTLADVRAFEKAHGAIPEGAILLIATGWDRHWTQPARYRNERDGVKHFPGISPEVASYLANERRVAGVGIDTPSVDYGPSTKFEVHRTMHARNVYHIENAAKLTTLPPRGFTLVVAPINLAGASGGPTRVFALLP
jgi:kynurenine formamidase